jgi:hypothetical protein
MRLNYRFSYFGLILFLLLIPVFSIEGGQLIFFLLVALGVAINRTYSKTFLLYFSYAFAIGIFYAFFSLISGGKWEIIIGSAFAFIFLLSFLTFLTLFRTLTDSQLKSALMAVALFFLTYVFILIYLSVFLPDYIRVLAKLDSNLSVAWFANMPRVMLKTMILMGPFSFIAIYFSKRKVLLSLLFLIVSILSQEVMVIFLIAVSVFINLILARKYIFTLISLLIVTLIVSLLFDFISELKAESIAEKMDQFQSFFYVLSENPLLGIGLGNPIENIGFNQTVIYFIEVVPIDYLIKFGFLGFILFTVLYLFPLVIGGLSYLKTKNEIILALSICHFLVVLSGLSNPYILSGSIGFLFPSMIFAYAQVLNLSHLRKNQHDNYSNGKL